MRHLERELIVDLCRKEEDLLVLGSSERRGPTLIIHKANGLPRKKFHGGTWPTRRTLNYLVSEGFLKRHTLTHHEGGQSYELTENGQKRAEEIIRESAEQGENK